MFAYHCKKIKAIFYTSYAFITKNIKENYVNFINRVLNINKITFKKKKDKNYMNTKP